MHPTLFLLSFRLPQPGSNFVQYKFRNIMDLSDITRLISSLRAQTARDSITPNGLGSILQRIVDAISSMSGIDVEDEAAILQRLSAAESNASTALQAAQNAQAGAAGNVIDSFTQSQDEDEVSLSIKQHGHSARQVVLPAASSTGAGIMTATDKSHLDTAYGKRVNLMSAPSSESVVTLTITFGDGTTKSVTFVGATAGTGGKAGLMTKEQADQLAALVAAGPAESVRDDAGYLKQQYAAPIILRNVTDTVFDDLAIGDVYYDTGHLFYHTEDQSGDPDIGAPSRKVIYYCLADQTLYRWTGSRFVQAVSISSGDVTVPTKLSDLINDMGFLTAHQPLKTINGETITGTGNITIDGAAELKDASNHIKQNSATPVVLRNVADTMLDDLNEGDVYFDSGHLFWHTESSSGDIDLGTPSKRLVYFCLGNSNFYRWGGSSFTKINMPAGTTPHIDPTTGNWFIGTTNTGVHAQGPKGNSVADGDTFDIVNNLTDGGEGDALSAEMGKWLYTTLYTIFTQLGTYAFPNGKPQIDWGGGNPPVIPPCSVSKTIGTGLSSTGGDSDVAFGDPLEVSIAITDNLYIVDDDSVVVTMGGSPVQGAWNASTMKVTIAAVTGNVVINIPSLTYVGYGEQNSPLVLMFDGMNQGETAGQWKDLANTSRSVALTGGYTKNSDNVQFDGTGYGSGNFVDDVVYNQSTVECVINQSNKTTPSSQAILLPGKTGAPTLGLFPLGNDIKWPTHVKAASDTYTVSRALYNWTGALNTKYSVSYYGNTMLQNGQKLTAPSASSVFEDAFNVNNHKDKTFVGAQITGANALLGFNGKIYCVRMYSRVLTDAEALQNWKVDQKRFNIS